ncbi:MAG TPA: acyl-[acyl-carrier-protein]--UDP-N-acetylglucosamine O-acyltransferase, partial [Opitutales bacterium]|nr:acyl-[acyl-carrier-protein]--UDP-N-acetylglucosamine O-acyltransferase [Opitutales bacterium]
DHMVMSSHAALGGHVIVGDYVNVGWGVGVHQFCRIGDYALLGASSKVVQDVPPLMLADGNPAQVRTINKVGLERAGFSPEDIDFAKELYRVLYRRGLNRSQAVAEIERLAQSSNRWGSAVVEFCKASKRGLA